jgi:DNA-binding transcriptional ArsR family regulator/ribosomal protein L40E
MPGSEEDPYSRIFSSLKHPTRRLLLRSLKEQPSKRFSKLQSELGIDSPTLSYHLDALAGLVERKGDGYSLTEVGAAAFNLMGRVEETKRARNSALSHRVRFGVGFVMVLVLLAWGVFALTWTIPNDRVSIIDSVVHGQQETLGIPLSVQPSTNRSYVLEMFHRPWTPGEGSITQPNGLRAYNLPMSSSSPWEAKVDYAVFSFLAAFKGGSNWSLWMTNPQGFLAPISCGLSCSIEYSPRIGSVASGFSISGLWFTEMGTEGNYTLWMQNLGPGLVYGNVTMGASTVVYSRPYFLAGALTILPAAGYLGLAAYSLVREMQRWMNQKGLEASKITAAQAEKMAESTPGSFLKKCKWCSAELPIAAERCYECGKPQT